MTKSDLLKMIAALEDEPAADAKGMRRILSFKEAGALLCCTPRTVQNLVRQGQLEAACLPKRQRARGVYSDSLEALLIRMQTRGCNSSDNKCGGDCNHAKLSIASN